MDFRKITCLMALILSQRISHSDAGKKDCSICSTIDDYIETEVSRRISSDIFEQLEDLKRATTANAQVLDYLTQEICSKYPGWYIPLNGYQYTVVGPLSWQAAREECQRLGGDLAVHGAQDYQIRLKISYALLKPRSIDYTWIGLSDAEEEGAWEWVDGSPVTDHAHWNSHQPDDHGEGQDCGAIWSESRDYRSDDGACHYKAYALCEKALDILPDH
ncbi:unnamed protein product [Clavelina lepadiformis]|uniref:C-type lectin domain-containing protein n=1 Tax=Clavelina lepadiformis TaxID=159417 RepID=A0ABP0GPH2_CLALP